MVERERHFVYHRTRIFEFHLLGQISDGDFFWARNTAFGRLLVTGNQFKQRRFSGSVLAHERHPFVFIQYERYFVEQRKTAEFDGEIFYGDHCLFVSFL